MTVLLSIFGWFIGDWRRLAGIALLAGIVGAYVTGDVRGRQAEAAKWQMKLDAQSRAFITAADKAKSDETKRQAQVGADVTAMFQHQQQIQDAAQAMSDASTESEIKNYEGKLSAARRACGAISPDDMGLLDAHP